MSPAPPRYGTSSARERALIKAARPPPEMTPEEFRERAEWLFGRTWKKHISLRAGVDSTTVHRWSRNPRGVVCALVAAWTALRANGIEL